MGLRNIWARSGSISGQRGKKMDFLFTGLGARIWGQLGARLGSPKMVQKARKPLVKGMDFFDLAKYSFKANLRRIKS